jgi:phosphoserine phosphatase RsbU/P
MSSRERVVAEKKEKSKFSLSYLKGTLTLRILIVCLSLLIVPLLFYGFTMSIRDYRFQMERLLLMLDGVGKMNACEIQNLIQRHLQILNTVKGLTNFSLLSEQGVPSEKISEEFTRVAESENLVGLFYNTIEPDGTYRSLATTISARLGKKSPVITGSNVDIITQKLASEKHVSFLADDPWTAQPRIYILVGVFSNEGKLVGFLASVINAKDLIEELKGKQKLFNFDLALLTDTGQLFVATDKDFSLGRIDIISAENLTYQAVGKFAETVELHRITHLFKEKLDYVGINVPVEQTSFSLLIEVPFAVLNKLRRGNELVRWLSLIGSVLIFGGAGTFWLTKRFNRPLKALAGVMERVGRGDLEARFKKDKMGFEINVLGARFNEMVDSLVGYIKKSEKERIAKERLENELKIAEEIQRSLLPMKMPEFPGIDISAGFRPAKEVGGDFYDVTVKKEGESEKLFFAIADASGKGISACLYSLDMRSMMRGFIAICPDLKDIVKETNNLFCVDTGDSGMFVTTWIGKFDPQKRSIELSNNGHFPAILKKKSGEIVKLTTEGVALGVSKLEQVNVTSVQIDSGDVLLLYSDGLIEAHNEEMQLYGKKRMIELFQKFADLSAEQYVELFLNDLTQYVKGAPQFDDVTLLVIRFL